MFSWFQKCYKFASYEWTILSFSTKWSFYIGQCKTIYIYNLWTHPEKVVVHSPSLSEFITVTILCTLPELLGLVELSVLAELCTVFLRLCLIQIAFFVSLGLSFLLQAFQFPIVVVVMSPVPALIFLPIK